MPLLCSHCLNQSAFNMPEPIFRNAVYRVTIFHDPDQLPAPFYELLRNSMSADLIYVILYFNDYTHFTDILRKNNPTLMTPTDFW